ncbi:MAG: AmmeMemoRadiSam system protein A, partial [candidate division KSB1 bacterium]
MLTPAQKQNLLRVARTALTALYADDSPTAVIPTGMEEIICGYSGVFVSLHVAEKLRGCIGNLNATAPLPELIVEMAQAAARHDPRFTPLRTEELGEVVIEISLLHAMAVVHAPHEVAIGRDGLMVRRGEKHGLLLPQVAAKRNWDAITFLE